MAKYTTKKLRGVQLVIFIKWLFIYNIITNWITKNTLLCSSACF